MAATLLLWLPLVSLSRRGDRRATTAGPVARARRPAVVGRPDDARRRSSADPGPAVAQPVGPPVSALVAVGQVVRVPAGHYCYGLGALTLRVTAVDPRPHPALEWLGIRGVEIRPDGTDGDERDVLVRVSALRRR